MLLFEQEKYTKSSKTYNEKSLFLEGRKFYHTYMVDNYRKRVAVLLAQPEEYAYDLFLKGFIEEAFTHDLDVCVFAMYIKYQNTPARSVGESSIFKLVDYDKFDCIVVLADSIQTKGVAQQIERELHDKYRGEVLFVDQESKYFQSIHIDNYIPEKKVITHLIEKHGVKDIAFLTGKSWHPHSKLRLQAYKNALEEHGIEVKEDRIFYGDFWYTSGESLADSLLLEPDDMPEAVAFANDLMAVGFCKRITSKGVRIPEDIKVVGFDCNVEGMQAPIPITSVPMGSRHLGMNAAVFADAMIRGKEPMLAKEDPDLFIGGTCGCGCDSCKCEYPKREQWDTDQSLGTIYSPFNNMDEDMIEQSTYTGMVSTIFSNLHLIRGFDSFSLCLNPSLGDESRGEFEDEIMEAIRCGSEKENNDRIINDSKFPREVMLPELYEYHEKPSVYYFMPIYFNDSVFGYGAIRYENRVEVTPPEYRAWLKSVARGIECYRRNDALIGSSTIARRGITTDSLTGLNNYKGFLENLETFLHLMKNNGGYMGALAVDIKDLKKINEAHGRKEGDRAIITVASALENVFSSRNCFCFRAGNDELVALRITSNPDEDELESVKDKLLDRIKEVSGEADLPYDIELYYASESGSPESSEEVERLVNVAISSKNRGKNVYKFAADASLSDEERHDALVVSSILDENKIAYHFQPIVDGRTGEIYAYEALMRPQVDPYLAPPVVLRYAQFYGRLYDVEKATFSGVIDTMSHNEKILRAGKKVFINSIPGFMLRGEDLQLLEAYVGKHPSSIVVELTEQSEVSDEDLKRMKNDYERIGIETAVDDYGTGYSNVNNLLRYTPNYVKIDRELLSGIEESPQKQHFVRDIIEFSHQNGIKALAEGIETREELKTVVMLGIDLIQGYYIGMPAGEMVQSINSLVVDEIHRYASLKQQGL